MMKNTLHLDPIEALQNFKEYHISVNELDVVVYRRGSGSKVILVHGWVGSAIHWSIAGYLMSEHHEVHIIDLPGHGQSEEPRQHSIELYSEAIRTIAEPFEEPAWIIGHSMGGAVAQDFADRHPEMVKGLVLVSTGLHFTSFLPKRIAKLMITQTMKMKSFMQDLGSFITKYIYRIKESYKVQRLNYAINLIRSYKVDTALNPFVDVIMKWNNVEKSYTEKPVLILCGSEDLLTPLQRSIEMNKVYKNSYLKIIPKEFHMLILTSAEVVYQAVKYFIQAYDETTI